MSLITMVVISLVIIATTEAQWKRADNFTKRLQRNNANGHREPTQNHHFWPGQENYINENWRRKCSKYDIVNSGKKYITGGSKAKMDMFPYLVGLLLYQPPRIYQCGGSLITERFVLTAAHCLYKTVKGTAFLGSYNYANSETASLVYNVTSQDFIIHERYGRQGFNDDIALIYFQKPVVLSTKVKLITLAPNYMTQLFLQGEIVTAAGWGRISDNNTELNIQLYYVDTRIIGFEKCMCYYLPGLVNSRSHLCADGSDGRGSCDGDSGGPLVYQHKNMDYQVGVTAFGSAGGCEIGFPTVYSRITSYLQWISRKTGLKIK